MPRKNTNSQQAETRKKKPNFKNDITANKYLTPVQVRNFLDTLKSVKKNRSDIYFFLMLCLLSGGRRVEILYTRRDCFSDGKIHIEARKNSRDRSIPLPVKFYKEILKWAPEEGLLFTNFCADQASTHMRRCLPDSINKILKRPLHALRHTFAMNFLRKTGKLRSLQYLLGNTIQNTVIYAEALTAEDDEWIIRTLFVKDRRRSYR